MFDPLDEDKKKENMTIDDLLLILVILFFYETDTNEVKGSYHDDCLEKNNNIFCILNWGIAVSCSRNMNFVKCRVSKTGAEKSFQCLIFFLYFLRIFALGPFLLIRLS